MRQHGRVLDGRTVGQRAQTGCGRRRGGDTMCGLRARGYKHDRRYLQRPK